MHLFTGSCLTQKGKFSFTFCIMCQIDDYTQALEYKLQENQEHVQVNGYSSFKFLQCALRLQ